MTACTGEGKRVHRTRMVPTYAKEWTYIPDNRHRGWFSEAFACFPKWNRAVRHSSLVYFFCMSGLPAFQAWPILSPVT